MIRSACCVVNLLGTITDEDRGRQKQVWHPKVGTS